LEEDAGKSVHNAGQDYSLVDLNRAGTPLLEIVSDPDMHSAAEAKAYARELYMRMRYADVSDANLYYGNMRFDVNVSVSKTKELGTRSETKNLNSFRAVEKAVDYEIDRQIVLLEKGQKIVQETRGWDDAKQKTFSQRSKENADDYRYMPDPDLPPIVLTDAFVAKVEAEMPIMPEQWRHKLESLGLDSPQVETLLEAEVDNEGIQYLKLLGDAINNKNASIVHVNFMINVEIPLRRENKLPLMSNVDRWAVYVDIIDKLMRTNKLSSTNAKALLADVLKSGERPADTEKYAEEKGYIQVSDESEIAKIVEQVIKDHPKAAEDVKNGEIKATQFLVGQVMKASNGKANPQLAQELITKVLQ
jgi:aspartyl-tRNA(Asn)/glutamyl-tRNA(Gln) amidotransferase subunit B